MAAAGEEVAGSPSAVEGSRRAAGRAAGDIVRIGREEGMLAADIEGRHRSSLGLPLLLSSGWVGW